MPYYNTSNSDTALCAPAKNSYACLLIGDELLAAQVEDSNLKRIVKTMSALGYKLQEARIISDVIEDIAKHLTELRNAYTFVITCGGLGPTHDDRTMQGYALSFDSKQILHQDMYNYFTKHAKKPQKHTRGDTKENTKGDTSEITYMSTMPQETEIIILDDSWPVIKLDNCFALPGLPSVCVTVLKKLALILPKHPTSFYAQCYITLLEHHYAAFLTHIAENYTTVQCGSYPIEKSLKNNNTKNKPDACSKITCTSDNKLDIEKCFSQICNYMNEKNVVTKIIPITNISEAISV